MIYRHMNRFEQIIECLANTAEFERSALALPGGLFGHFMSFYGLISPQSGFMV